LAQLSSEGSGREGLPSRLRGSDEVGFSAYSPDLPGVVAAGDTRSEAEELTLEAMAEHIALLRRAGTPVPEPGDADSITLLDPAAA
jgi:predicted RNase H-like HicB family nuclease